MTTGSLPTRRILGLDVAVLDRTMALAHIAAAVAARRKTLVAFANTNLALTGKRLGLVRQLAGDERWLVLNDGLGMDVASRLLFGAPFPDNLNGTDFTPALLAALPPGTRVFLYGARPVSLSGAADKLARTTSAVICGWRDGYRAGDGETIAAINDAAPDVLLVALGNPRQEQWMLHHADQVSAPVILGVGALFDFLSGQARRAPLWVRRIRLEWIYRLLREPRRLARRYTWDLVIFLALVISQRASAAPD